MNIRPIIIAGSPRSGTTMLAGLLHNHSNIWVGRARTTLYPGTNCVFGSENQDIKDLMKREGKRIGYKNWNPKLPDLLNYDRNMFHSLARIVPDDVQWLVKTSWTLVFHRFWIDSFPDAKWIITYRHVNSILSSMRDHPGMRKRSIDKRKRFVLALMQRQKEVESLVKYTTKLHMWKFTRKDKSEIEKLFNFLNIDINWEIINSWIKPEMFKRRA